MTGNSFGIVVISDDKNEEEFTEHMMTNPWPSLGFSENKTKKQLKHRYHVTGLPKLVIVDSKNGNVINSDAKSNVEADSEGVNFPWPEPKVHDLLLGEALLQDEVLDLKTHLKTKTVVGLYFSADWCPPCRIFSPILARLHSCLKENGFEVLYCSMDKIEEKFLATVRAVSWPSYPFKDERVRLLAKALHVEDIPQLVVWDLEKEEVVNRNAIGRIRLDPTGEKFPWRQELVTVLTTGNISEMSSQVVFLFIATSSEKMQTIVPDMTLAAKKFLDYRFYVASDEDVVVAHLREILQVGDQCPYLLFLDFESRTWARCRERSPEGSHIEAFVEAAIAGEVESVDFPATN